MSTGPRRGLWRVVADLNTMADESPWRISLPLASAVAVCMFALFSIGDGLGRGIVAAAIFFFVALLFIGVPFALRSRLLRRKRGN